MRLRLIITFGLLALLFWTQQAAQRPGWAGGRTQVVARSSGGTNLTAQRAAEFSNTVARGAWCPSWLSASACPENAAMFVSVRNGEQPGSMMNTAAHEKARCLVPVRGKLQPLGCSPIE